MTLLARIAERVINRPLLVHPDKLPIVLDVLHGRIPLSDVSDLRSVAERNIDAMPDAAQTIMRGPHPGASRFVGESFETDAGGRATKALPYRRTSEGVAVITVTGSLINRGAWVGASSGETSYEGIKHQVASAAADGKVRAILLDIESPGGEAVGAFEAADAIRAAAKVKPVTAVVNGMAASAAYALASAASQIIVTPTGLAGSIGVVMLHADYSGFLEKKGVKPTLIFAGAHKVDGNPFEPLPDGVRQDLQTEVNDFYALFVKTVTSGRAGMTAAMVRGTEARTFMGKSAVDQGLADKLGTFESALADITRGLARATSISKRGAKMDTTEGAPAATAGISLTDHNAAVSKASQDATAAGAKASQDRIKGILNCEQAKGREGMAQHLAFETDTSVEAAVAILDKTPKADAAPAPAPAAAVPPLAQRQSDALALGGNAPKAEAPKADLDTAAIYESRRKAVGR